MPHDDTISAIYLRLPDVRLTTGLSQATIHRLIKAGAFPAPKKLSPGAVGWLKRDVLAWVNSREAVKH